MDGAFGGCALTLAKKGMDDMEQNEQKSLEQIVEEIQKQPVTVKDQVVGFILSVLFIGLCVGTWLYPDLISIDTGNFSGHGGRKIARILNFIWSRPVGTVAGIIGLLVGRGVLTQKVGSIPADKKKKG